MIRRKMRSPRSLERKAGTRVQPPGKFGRPRRHYPPVWYGRVYDAKLIVTIRAKLHDPDSGDGEFAVVRDTLGFRIWSNDENVGHACWVFRKDAVKEARKLARQFDRAVRVRRRAAVIDANFDALQAEFDRLNALENDEKVALGCRLPGPHGKRWRLLTNVLVLSPDDPLCRPLPRRAATLRDDVRAWCEDNGVPVLLFSMPFAHAHAGTYKVPVHCYAVSFEDPLHAVAFKLVWWGDHGT